MFSLPITRALTMHHSCQVTPDPRPTICDTFLTAPAGCGPGAPANVAHSCIFVFFFRYAVWIPAGGEGLLQNCRSIFILRFLETPDSGIVAVGVFGYNSRMAIDGGGVARLSM
jgi:hypothetical protein